MFSGTCTVGISQRQFSTTCPLRSIKSCWVPPSRLRSTGSSRRNSPTHQEIQIRQISSSNYARASTYAKECGRQRRDHVGEDLSAVVARSDVPALDLAQLAEEKSSLRSESGHRCPQRPLLLAHVGPCVHVPCCRSRARRACAQAVSCMRDICFSDAL